jgi:cation-transporting ATPase E
MTYPLQASQITFISMFNIGIPGLLFALESNTRRNEGKFIINVMLKAMPAALTDFFAIAALVVFGETFGVSTEDISVAATFVMVFVGFLILIKISSPMNTFRFRVIAGCVIGMIFTAVVFSDLFAISYMSTECFMLSVLFVIATEPCMRYLTMAFEKLDQFIQSKILKSSDHHSHKEVL